MFITVENQYYHTVFALSCLDLMNSKNVTGSFALILLAEMVAGLRPHAAQYKCSSSKPKRKEILQVLPASVINLMKTRYFFSPHTVATRLYVNCIKTAAKKCN